MIITGCFGRLHSAYQWPLSGYRPEHYHSYAYNENKIVRADAYESNFSTGAPKRVVNFWISYRLPLKGIKGIGFGFGGNYASDS